MIYPDHIVMHLFDVITQVMRCSTVMILKEKTHHNREPCNQHFLGCRCKKRRCILLYQIKVLKSFAVKVVFHTSQFYRHQFTIENIRIRSGWILQGKTFGCGVVNVDTLMLQKKHKLQGTLLFS